MKRRDLILAAGIVFSLPALADEKYTLTEVEKNAHSVRIKKDEFNGTKIYNLPIPIPANENIMESQAGLLAMFTDNKSEMSDAFGLLFSINYIDKRPRKYDTVFDSDKNKMTVVPMTTDTELFVEKGIISEVFIAHLSWDYYYDHAETGIKMRAYGKHGEFVDVFISPDQVKGFLKKTSYDFSFHEMQRSVTDLTYVKEFTERSDKVMNAMKFK